MLRIREPTIRDAHRGTYCATRRLSFVSSGNMIRRRSFVPLRNKIRRLFKLVVRVVVEINTSTRIRHSIVIADINPAKGMNSVAKGMNSSSVSPCRQGTTVVRVAKGMNSSPLVRLLKGRKLLADGPWTCVPPRNHMGHHPSV